MTAMDPGEPALLYRAVPVNLRLSAHEKRSLQSYAVELCDGIADGRVFTCLITNDAHLRKLNREFLNNDYATDVLSFPVEGGNEIGDLAISSERAAAQATEFGHSFFDELRILILHGVLHLVGYDHETDKGEMRKAEQRWRKKLQLPDTLIARTKVGAGQR